MAVDESSSHGDGQVGKSTKEAGERKQSSCHIVILNQVWHCSYLMVPIGKVFSVFGFWVFFFFFFCLFVFLEPHSWHMEVPGLGSNWSCSCRATPQPQQCEIQATSVTYTTAQGYARSFTHWVRPGIEPTSSWMLVGFLNHWALTGPLPVGTFLKRIVVPSREATGGEMGTERGNLSSAEWVVRKGSVGSQAGTGKLLHK